MLEKPKPYIYTCINCGENEYSIEAKNKHICKSTIHESEKRSLTLELNSLNQRREVILRKLQIIKEKESSNNVVTEKKETKKSTSKRVKKSKKIEEAEITEL